jgi:hypothetical protein
MIECRIDIISGRSAQAQRLQWSLFRHDLSGAAASALFLVLRLLAFSFTPHQN